MSSVGPRFVTASPAGPTYRRPTLQRFTAEFEGDRVFLKREAKDTAADWKRATGERAGAFAADVDGRVDVSEALGPGVVAALRTGPLNCAHFVKTALEGSKPPLEEQSTLFTVALWEELLASGFKVSGVWKVSKEGEVTRGKSSNKQHKIATPQTDPKLGDIVFMKGDISFRKNRPTTIDPAGANFNVTWDHVGIFLVRDRKGRDWHLAKDGDENPLGIYHTGMSMEEGMSQGAYVAGIETLLVYLSPPIKRASDWQDAGAGRR
jgi:hypothetical protein